MILLFALLALVLGTINSGFFLYRISLLLFIAGWWSSSPGGNIWRRFRFPWHFCSDDSFLHVVGPDHLSAPDCRFQDRNFLLIWCGIPAVREGNIILLPTARLEVAEACSGIRSLFSLITLTVIYGYLAETESESRVLLALMAVPVSVLANALRIAVTGVVVEYGASKARRGRFTCSRDGLSLPARWR